ncbi:MAG TPA: class I fructose-bisphosphate aldolase, partial [Actinomycetota bacterium]|nr:class I fructose-bisphosphate aldolase [Actinomycetota bacterium]
MTNDLQTTARELVAERKGILAADESFPTIEKRFTGIGIESTEENRRGYRDMLFTTPGLEEFISGVIMFDETIRQAAADGTSFSELLASKGVIPGIKVDAGAKDLALFPGEKVTEGLDGLRKRCEEYVSLGARFTKWRAVITIGDGIPTDFCIHANAHALARYAALSQEAGLVPIVEPEVLMDGDHSIDRCYEVTERTLAAVFEQLADHHVSLPGTLLKTNMVLSGKDASDRANVEEVARRTVECLTKVVPADIPGVVFLSGGQSDEEATAHLNEMNKLGSHP